MSVDVKYSTTATATGGRDGEAKTDDGAFSVKLAAPKELGGTGDGNNPEQLFAAGYAACYLGAMKHVASLGETAKVPDGTTVTATVGLGPRDAGGFGIKADLAVSLPGLSQAEAADLTEKAHHICPYSNATRGNVEVTTTIV